MDLIDVVLRLSVATLAGVALGLNRDLRGKPTGVRTLGLVGLGSALAVMAVAESGDTNAVSRVIQGLVTGIGFLGAGVIIHNSEGRQVHGLTTAACAWLTACIGAACGVGAWRIVLVTVPLIFLVLIFGGPLERAVRRYWRDPEDDASN
jgi:putative Mg2+ transporter-C (MgtC) family protein